MHQYLKYEGEERPKLIFFETCRDSIRSIPTLVHDEKKPEDLDSRGDDHIADALRYLLASLHERKAPKPKTDVERKLEEMKKTQGVNPLAFNDFYGY